MMSSKICFIKPKSTKMSEATATPHKEGIAAAVFDEDGNHHKREVGRWEAAE